MKKSRYFLTTLGLCICMSGLFAQVKAQVVSAQTITKSFAVNTTDTLWFAFPPALGVSGVAPDTGSATFDPPNLVRSCRQLKFTYKKVAGSTSDSLRVKLKPLSPSGVIVAGDSIFVVGTASTYSVTNTTTLKGVDCSDAFDLAFGVAVIVTHGSRASGVRRYQFEIYTQ